MFLTSIRTRLTLPFLLAITLTAMLGVFVVTRLVAGSIQERFNNQLLDSSQSAANSITEIEQQQLSILRSMVFTEGIDQAVVDRDTDLLERWLRPIAANNQVHHIIVFDAQGNAFFNLQWVETAAQYERQPSPDLTEWEGIQRIIQQETDVLGDKFVDVVGNAPDTVLYVNAPIMNADQALVGGISLGITAEQLSQEVSHQALSSVTFYDLNGDILGSTFRAVTWNTLALSASETQQLLAEAQTSSPIKTTEIDGVGFQTLYAPFELRSQPMGLVAVSLQSSYLGERISVSRNMFIGLFVMLFLGVGAIGLVTARSITNPVDKLVDTTRAIRSGDLSRRVQLVRRDELGELSNSFDHMTDQLVERNQEINHLYVQQLAETARREAVLTSISDAVIVQDLNGKIIMQNQAGRDLLTLLDTSSMLRNSDRFVEPETRQIGARYFRVTAKPVKMVDTEALLGKVLVFTDITALIETEQLKDELMKQMSHELRTPLSAALGYVELVGALEKDNISAQSQGFIAHSVDHLMTLERMVNQVIEVSSIVSQTFALDLEDFDLSGLVAEVMATWQPYFQQRELQFTVHGIDKPLMVVGDRRRLGQVFEHLLRNAYSYTLPSGSVDLRIGHDEQTLTCVVEDTGVGIAKEEHQLVFERMYRGRSADAGPTDTRGLGLGLYLSERIVTAHAGTISLTSEEAIGTTVTVTLPMQQVISLV